MESSPSHLKRTSSLPSSMPASNSQGSISLTPPSPSRASNGAAVLGASGQTMTGDGNMKADSREGSQLQSRKAELERKLQQVRGTCQEIFLTYNEVFLH